MERSPSAGTARGEGFDRRRSGAGLQPKTESRSERVRQLRRLTDLPRRLPVVVGHAAEGDEVVVEDDVAGARVAVARLADRADVHEELPAHHREGLLDLVLRNE